MQRRGPCENMRTLLLRQGLEVGTIPGVYGVLHTSSMAKSKAHVTGFEGALQDITSKLHGE